MRHTRSHTGNRRSHHALTPVVTVACAKCGTMVLPHHACANCGTYRSRTAIDVMKKLTKKEQKAKAKALAAEQAPREAGQNLDAAELSQK